MKKLSLLILLLGFCGCMTPQQVVEDNFKYGPFDYPGTREDYVNAHPNLSKEIKKAISTGWPVEGMTIDELHACLQEPVKTRSAWSDGTVICYREVYAFQKMNEPSTLRDAFFGADFGTKIVYYTFRNNKLVSWSVHN